MEKSKYCNNAGKISEAIILAISIVIAIAIFVIGATMSNKPTTTSSSSNTNKQVEGKDENKTKAPEKNYISIGESVSSKDWEFKILEVKFDQRINPPNRSGFYNYYQVDDTSNTYLCVILEAKNVSSLELSADEIATIKVKYKDNYTYSSFSTIEDSNLGFTYTSITRIDPLTSKKVYYLAEMPKMIADETDTPVEVEIKVNNTTYYYKVR